MKFINYLFFFVSFNCLGQTTIFQWAKNQGGLDEDKSLAIQVDASGNVYTCGYFKGVCDFDPGPLSYTLSSIGKYDIFISKLDANGNFMWAKNIGDTLNDVANALNIDYAGDICITGYFNGTVDFDPGPASNSLTAFSNGDIFILKLDPNGNFLWVRGMGDIGFDYGNSITSDNAGNIYTTGMFMATVDFDGSPGIFSITSKDSSQDVFVLKLSGSGGFLWAKKMGDKNTDRASSITLDNSGNICLVGYFWTFTDLDPGPSTYTVNSNGSNASDIFVLKLDNNGIFTWGKTFRGLGFDQGYSIVADASGNIYTSGYFEGTNDFDPGPATYNLTSAGSTRAFITKLDAAGNFVWAKDMGGNSMGFALALDQAKNVYLTGQFYGPADFDPSSSVFNLPSAGNTDAFILKLDSTGSFVWAKNLGGPSGDTGYGIKVDAAGNVYTTGSFYGTADFDQEAGVFNLTCAGNIDIFTHKMSQNINNVQSFEFSLNQINIFPNPASDKIYFNGEQLSKEKTEVIITNQLGQIVLKQSYSNEIDISNFAKGIYFLSVQNELKHRAFKIIKE